jgi:hypothetical protein
MLTTGRLSENSRQGFEVQNPACIGPENFLSQNTRWACGHAYDETPVGIAVYVRNDPVNFVDPDGRFACALPGCNYLDPWSFLYDIAYFNPFNPLPQDVLPESVRMHQEELGRRETILKGVRGTNDQNIMDCIRGGCEAFINEMIKQLQPSYVYQSAQDWVRWNLNHTAIFDHFGADDDPDADARRDLGSNGYADTKGNTIYLGEKFFSDTTHDSVLTTIHELFHLSAVSPTGENLGHPELLGLAAKAGYTDTGSSMLANEAWNYLMQSQCGKRQ